MSTPTWTILIPTISQRDALFRRLLAVLLPQLDEHAGMVRVMAWLNDGQPPLGEVRDRMIEAAGTDYVSFIDDDDLVPDYYVAEIVQALHQEPDHVGFKIDYSVDGVGKEIVDHSLHWGRWGRSSEGQLYRDFTHIDPVRREHAMRGYFNRARAGRAEDRVWVKQVRKHLVTEVYIDKIMYHYLWRTDLSAWQQPQRIVPGTLGRPLVDHPHFTWHPASN